MSYLSMTLFIQKGNLKIIWDVISMSPLFNELFTTEIAKKEWFNKIIEHVQKQLSKNVSIDELGNINRETIKLMVANIKEQYLKVSTDIASRPKPLIIGSESDTPFLRRQKEYETMKAVYVPPQIDFRSIEIDEPITNMSELIEKHKNERVDAYSSNDSILWASPSPSSSIILNDDISPIKRDKHVTWTSPICVDEFKVINKKLDIIMGFMKITLPPDSETRLFCEAKSPQVVKLNRCNSI